MPPQQQIQLNPESMSYKIAPSTFGRMRSDLNMNLNDSQKLELLKIEYSEAISTYFRGVDIGINWMKSYFVLNGLLLALYGTILKLIENPSEITKFVYILHVIPAIGIVGAILIMLFIPFYRQQLENCQNRCEDIENFFGGQLFHKIINTSENKERNFDVMKLISSISIIFIILWAFFILNIYISVI